MKNIVLLSTFNGEKFIKAQLDSIAKCRHRFPILIYWYDDYSSDRTVRIVRHYKKLHIVEIKRIAQSTIANNFRYLIETAIDQEGADNIFYFCDQDDLWNCEKIWNAEEFFKFKYGLLLTCTKTFGIIEKLIRPNLSRFFLLDFFYNVSPGMSFVFKPERSEKLVSFLRRFRWHDHGSFLYFKYVEKNLHDSPLIAQMYRRHKSAVTLELKLLDINRLFYGIDNLTKYSMWVLACKKK